MVRTRKKSAGGKKLSTYQRKTRRISRFRSLRRALRQFFRRGYYATGAVAVILTVSAGWWWVQSGKLSVLWEGAKQAMLAQTVHAGLSLQYIYLDGRQHTNLEDITLSLGLEAGDPILGVSVDGIKERLLALRWVKGVTVERQLPDTLHVHIHERTPVAVWQADGKFQLLDDTGTAIAEANPKDPAYLPLMLVVGEDAPSHMPVLVSMLQAEPDLATQVKSAVWVKNGRWDVRFESGVEVKLPAHNPERAWAILAEMERQQQVLSRDIRAVDLRIEDRVFIDLTNEKPEAITRGIPSV